MKITFLGTSHGYPEIGRYCAGILVEHSGHGFIIDAGAPLDYLFRNRGIRPESVKAYFITHMHADHTASLTSIAKTYTVYYKDGDADIFFPEETAIQPFRAWVAAQHLNMNPAKLRLRAVKPGVIYSDYGIQVTAIRTEHIAPDIPSYAYMIESDNGKRVLFTGDLAYDFHDFPAVAYEKPFDLIVSELTHFSADKAQPILDRADTKQMIFSHVTPSNTALLESQHIRFHFPHLVAVDGFEFFVS